MVEAHIDKAENFKVVPLDESGKEGKPLAAHVENGSPKFTLSPQDHTVCYLVEAAP